MSDELECKPKGDKRRKWQLEILKTLFEPKNHNFSSVCILARFKEKNYDNIPEPKNIEEFEFCLKGFLRCEMGNLNKKYRKWRRLLGTSTKKKDNEEWERKFKDFPRNWKSRIQFSAFEDKKEVSQFLSECPLGRWPEQTQCPLIVFLEEIKEDDWIVLSQIRDIKLKSSLTFAEWFKDFLSDSKILEPVGEHICPIMPAL